MNTKDSAQSKSRLCPAMYAGRILQIFKKCESLFVQSTVNLTELYKSVNLSLYAEHGEHSLHSEQSESYRA